VDYESVFGEIAKAKRMIEEERSEYFRRWCLSTLTRINAVVGNAVSGIEAAGSDLSLSMEERQELIAKLSDESKKLLAWASAQTYSQIGSSEVPFISIPSDSKIN